MNGIRSAYGYQDTLSQSTEPFASPSARKGGRFAIKDRGILYAKKIIIILPAIFLVLMTIFRTPAFSHPHVFITQKVKISFDDHGLAGFTMYWIFDDMFTAAIAGDYDKNRNKVLEKSEVALIEKEAFSYLANYNYFTFIKIDGKSFPVKVVRNFLAALLENKLVYTFFIPCHVPAARSLKHVVVASYDPSYYSAIFFDNIKMVSIDNARAFKVKTVIQKDKSTSIYFGQVSPWTLYLDFCAK